MAEGSEASNRRPLMIVESQSPTRKLKMRQVCFPGFANKTACEFTEYTFLVHFDALAWHVHRRFSEFVKFDNDLRRIFKPDETRGVERLPEKTILGSNASDRLIEERRWRLEAYLNSLARADAVMESGLVKDFLQFPDQELLRAREQEPRSAFLAGPAMVPARPGAQRPLTERRVLCSRIALSAAHARPRQVCRGCRTPLLELRDDIESGKCSVCARHTLSLVL
jgi:hypothetical protein